MADRRAAVDFLAGRGGKIALGVLGAVVAIVIVVGSFGGSSKPAGLADASSRAADSTPPPAAAATPPSALSGSASGPGSASGSPSPAGSPSPGGARPGLPYSAALAEASGTGSGFVLDATTSSGTHGAGTAGSGTFGEDALAPAAADGPTQASGSVYYDNCTAAQDAGVTPLYRGAPGYRAGLDADDDGIACEATSSTTTLTSASSVPAASSDPAPVTGSGSTYYANCTAARNAGVTNLHRGDPGYRAALDADRDGIACQTPPSTSTRSTAGSTSTVQQPPAAPPTTPVTTPTPAASVPPPPSTAPSPVSLANQASPATESASQPPSPAPAPAPTTAPAPVPTTAPVPVS
ncbi:putative calcium-binding protein [Frankia torreyi]|uniref:Putative calcium-binding protein n=1 Tax=Frankia torreyi TaxID=1856 RepID=A0A0D8BFH5_9ACTN|nr:MULTISPECIES: excalibur calcium-binding domain-containing protein [Frankia]KJE22795.1 putative calcium-binding protein [Frankia torreyi]KQM04744.1 putative calcium-binding protein [Frankia sp. CpI1-P]